VCSGGVEMHAHWQDTSAELTLHLHASTFWLTTTCAHTHARTHTYTCTHTHSHTHTLTHTHIYTHTRANTYTQSAHTHARTQVEEEWQRQTADLEGEHNQLTPDSPLTSVIAEQLKLRMQEVEQRIIGATGVCVRVRVCNLCVFDMHVCI